MYTAIAIIHVVVCVFLIMVVLLQAGKGADIGAVFGGGSSQALFGSAGPGTFLGKVTVVMAVIFMLTSVSLAGRFFERPVSKVVEEPAATSKIPSEQTREGAPVVPEKAPERQ